MGVNWDKFDNPALIRNVHFIPQIALPTVFDDALSYAEVQGKIIAQLNGVINNVNTIANDLANSVLQAIADAKIPEYFQLKHNGSLIVDPNNWTIDNPKDLWDAVGSGKLCILNANATYNTDGDAVPNDDNGNYLILNSAYQADMGSYLYLQCNFATIFGPAPFGAVLCIVNLYKENNEYTCTVSHFKLLEFTSEEVIDDLNNKIRNKLLVYKGDTPISGTAENYVQLTANGSGSNIDEFFLKAGDEHIFAANVCPCIVVDKATGNLGILKYGGLTNPWVRIYSVGMNIVSELRTNVAGLLNNLNTMISDIYDLNHDVDDLDQRVGTLETNVDNLDTNAVKTVSQELTDTQKRIARTNIGACSSVGPDISGTITYSNETQSVDITLEPLSDNKSAVMFEGRTPIIRGIGTPVQDNDGANKKYVDDVLGVVPVVKYVSQSLTSEQMRQARLNIDAVGKNQPSVYTQLEISNYSEENPGLLFMDSNMNAGVLAMINGNLYFLNTPEYNNIAVTPSVMVPVYVGEPTQDYHAATKGYVDSRTANTKITISCDGTTDTWSESSGATWLQIWQAASNGGLHVMLATGTEELISDVVSVKNGNRKIYAEFMTDTGITVVHIYNGGLMERNTLTYDA